MSYPYRLRPTKIIKPKFKDATYKNTIRVNEENMYFECIVIMNGKRCLHQTSNPRDIRIHINGHYGDKWVVKDIDINKIQIHKKQQSQQQQPYHHHHHHHHYKWNEDGDVNDPWGPPLKKRKFNHDLTMYKQKKMKKGVKEWTFYDIIYWLNRVNGGKLGGIQYINLRKIIFESKFKGSELHSITDAALTFNGIYDDKKRGIILELIKDLLINDTFDNIAANTMITDNVETCFCDPISYEIMDDPVLVTVSGNTYNRKMIEEYIKKYKKDPISQQTADLKDIIPNKNLKQSIDIWIKQHLF